MNEKIIKNQKGQILLFVVIAMSVALAIGIAISSRTLSSLQRTAKTDTASRVFAAAEGGVEQFVLYPDYMLDGINKDLISNMDELSQGCSDLGYGFYNDPDEDGEEGCLLEYDVSSEGDEIVAQAIVYVRNFSVNDGDYYTFDLIEGNTTEVTLRDDYADPSSSFEGWVDVCWYNPEAQLYVTIYDESGPAIKDVLASNDYSGANALYNPNFFTIVPAPGPGDPYCNRYNQGSIIIPGIQNKAGIRIKALGDSTKVTIKTENANQFPTQGFEIVSKGQLQQEGETKSIKVVRAYKSFSFMPDIFDSAIYSEGVIAE